MSETRRGLYGILAEFSEADALLHALHESRKAGFRRLDAFTPFPVDGLSEALGLTGDRVPLLTLFGGVLGGSLGFLMQWYASVIDYPINVGGRPLNSWPAFIIITFELTVLGAALSAALGMIALNRLPTLYHPVFTQENFSRASKDGFFLSIEALDPRFDLSSTTQFLLGLGARTVTEVPHEP